MTEMRRDPPRKIDWPWAPRPHVIPPAPPPGPKVYNRRNLPATTQGMHGPLYIGRGSPYGNPFVIGKHGNRDEVCDLFEQMVAEMPTEQVERWKRELRGRDLVCYCKPKRCHGDFLLKLANDPQPLQTTHRAYLHIED